MSIPTIASAVASLYLIFFLTGKNLRPRILLDHFIIFYLTFASLVALHVQLLSEGSISLSFFLLFFVSSCFFVATYSTTSIWLSPRLTGHLARYAANGDCIKQRISSIINNLKPPFLFMLILSTCFLLAINIQYIAAGSTAYVDKVEANLSSPWSRYLIYTSFITTSISSYFPSLLLFADFRTVKPLRRTLFGLALLISYVSVFSLGSRGALAAVLYPMGLYIILFPRRSEISQFISRTQLLLVPLIVLFAAIVTAKALDINDYLASSGDLFGLVLQRTLSNADVATIFHGSRLKVSQFNDFDGFYYLLPVFKLFGVDSGSTSLGIRIGELAGQSFGKGPVPTYFYESLLLFKNDLGVYLVSAIAGFLVSSFRFLSLHYLYKGISNPAWLPFAFAFYLATPIGDWNLFIITFTFSLLSAWFIRISLKLRIN